MREPSPETFPHNRDVIASKVAKALKRGGIDIPSKRLTDALIDLVTAERIEVRETAGEIIEAVVGRYESFDDERLERLAFVVRRYYRDDAGTIQIAFTDGEGGEA